MRKQERLCIAVEKVEDGGTFEDISKEYNIPKEDLILEYGFQNQHIPMHEIRDMD